MKIKQRFILDLAKGSTKPMAVAVQGEANTRVLVVSLFDKGAEWKVPTGTTAAVAFRKPDGKSGLYDTLPDGSPAAEIAGNTVEATLAPQALTTSGRVSVAIMFYDAEGDTLATFPFWIIVEPNPAAGEQISNDYYKITTLAELNAAFEAKVKEWEQRAESGEFTGPPGPPGPKGADGTMSFEDLTDEQRESLRGPAGPQGADGVSGVWVGSEAPPDDSYTVWINPAGGSSVPGGSGSGGSLDAYVEGETLVFTASSTATIENETLIL